MQVAVLQPHDCLKRHPHQHQRRRYFNPVTVNPNTVNPTRSNRRRRNSPSPPHGPSTAQQARPKSPPVMGQVRIIKRGEDLSPSLFSPPSAPETMMVSEPEIVRSKSGPFIDGFYAGSAFIVSPSPSEVPLPGFCGKKTGGESHNQEIACELRKVLKLL